MHSETLKITPEMAQLRIRVKVPKLTVLRLRIAVGLLWLASRIGGGQLTVEADTGGEST